MEAGVFRNKFYCTIDNKGECQIVEKLESQLSAQTEVYGELVKIAQGLVEVEREAIKADLSPSEFPPPMFWDIFDNLKSALAKAEGREG